MAKIAQGLNRLSPELTPKPTATFECLGHEFESHKLHIVQNLFFNFFLFKKEQFSLVLITHQRKIYVDEGPGQTLRASK